MATLLTLDFKLKPQREQKPIIENEAWLDVSGVALGVGHNPSTPQDHLQG